MSLAQRTRDVVLDVGLLLAHRLRCWYINPSIAETDFRRQHRQILTSKVDTRNERIKYL